MEAIISDITGELLAANVLPQSSEVTFSGGGLKFHMTVEEQLEVVEFIAQMQEERWPEDMRISGEFKTIGNAREALNKRAEAQAKAEEQARRAEEAGITVEELMEFED